MPESGPTQHADDLRARIATSLQRSFVGAEMDRRDTEDVTLTVHDTEKAADRLIATVVGSEHDLVELRAQREVANKYALEQQERADHLSWDLLAIQRALGWHGDALLDRGLVEARISRIRTERDEAQRAVSRLSGGNTPADAATVLLEAAMEFQAARDAEDPEHNINDAYFEEQAAFQIRKLAEAGWGSAVATPADTQADPWRMDEWHALPDVCFINACESPDTDQRGPVFLRDGSIHKACQDHWEPIHRVLGEQVGSSDDMRSAPSVGADPEDEVGREAREDAEDRDTADAIRVAPDAGGTP